MQVTLCYLKRLYRFVRNISTICKKFTKLYVHELIVFYSIFLSPHYIWMSIWPVVYPTIPPKHPVLVGKIVPVTLWDPSRRVGRHQVSYLLLRHEPLSSLLIVFKLLSPTIGLEESLSFRHFMDSVSKVHLFPETKERNLSPFLCRCVVPFQLSQR